MLLHCKVVDCGELVVLFNPLFRFYHIIDTAHGDTVTAYGAHVRMWKQATHANAVEEFAPVSCTVTASLLYEHQYTVNSKEEKMFISLCILERFEISSRLVSLRSHCVDPFSSASSVLTEAHSIAIFSSRSFRQIKIKSRVLLRETGKSSATKVDTCDSVFLFVLFVFVYIILFGLLFNFRR